MPSTTTFWPAAYRMIGALAMAGLLLGAVPAGAQERLPWDTREGNRTITPYDQQQETAPDRYEPRPYGQSIPNYGAPPAYSGRGDEPYRAPPRQPDTYREAYQDGQRRPVPWQGDRDQQTTVPGGYGDPGYDPQYDRRYDPPPPPYRDGYGAPPPPRRYEEPPPREGTFSMREIRDAGHGFFGSISQGLASVIEYAFKRQGRPNGYILGEDVGGAFVAGLRYGEGMLYTKDAGHHKVYWQGPSLGYDAGAEGSKVMVLVYNLRDPEQMYRRFGGIDGSAYVVGGVGMTFLSHGDVILAPIRSGIGLRLGANIGYLKYTRRPTWNPF